MFHLHHLFTGYVIRFVLVDIILISDILISLRSSIYSVFISFLSVILYFMLTYCDFSANLLLEASKNLIERSDHMAKGRSCKPSAKVSKAGHILSTSKSSSAKSKAGTTLAKHKSTNH